MFVTKLKIAGGIAATFLILVSLAGVAMYSSHAAENAPAPAPVNVAAAPAPVAPKVPPRPTPKDDQPAPAAATAPFAQAIANLGSDDVQTRIAAMDELRKAGAKAQSALEAATKQDGAAKNRAAELLGVLKTAPVVEQLVAQAKKLKTFEVDLTTTMIMGGIPLVSKGHVKGVPAKNKYISDASMNFGPMDMTTHIICDGAIIWMELTTPAPGNGTQKMVMKQPLDDPGARNQLDGVDFSTYSDQYDFTSTRVEKRDNSDVYVLEGAVREDYREKLKHELDDAGAWANQGAQQINAQQSCVVVVGKDDGLVRKSEVRDDKGVVTNTTEFSGFKLGTALEDSAFIYCPPPNVTVMDTAELKKNLKAKAPPAAPKSTEKKDF